MSIYTSMPLEEFDGSVENRYQRDIAGHESIVTDTEGNADDRAGRTWKKQHEHRQARNYYNDETNTSALTGADIPESYEMTSDTYTDEDAQIEGLVPEPDAFVVSDEDPVAPEPDPEPDV